VPVLEIEPSTGRLNLLVLLLDQPVFATKMEDGFAF